MHTTDKLFQVEYRGETALVTAQVSLGEFEHQRLESELAELLEQLNNGSLRNVVIDFRESEYFGSTALGFFVKLWRRIRQRDGHMVLCNLSPHEAETLELTSLDTIWPTFTTVQDALKAIGQ